MKGCVDSFNGARYPDYMLYSMFSPYRNHTGLVVVSPLMTMASYDVRYSMLDPGPRMIPAAKRYVCVRVCACVHGAAVALRWGREAACRRYRYLATPPLEHVEAALRTVPSLVPVALPRTRVAAAGSLLVHTRLTQLANISNAAFATNSFVRRSLAPVSPCAWACPRRWPTTCRRTTTTRNRE